MLRSGGTIDVLSEFERGAAVILQFPLQNSLARSGGLTATNGRSTTIPAEELL